MNRKKYYIILHYIILHYIIFYTFSISFLPLCLFYIVLQCDKCNKNIPNMKMWFKVILDGLNHVTYNLKLALKFPSNLLQDKVQNQIRASHKSIKIHIL